MRTILALLLAATVAASCTSNKKPVAPAVNVFPTTYKYDTLEGLYPALTMEALFTLT